MAKNRSKNSPLHYVPRMIRAIGGFVAVLAAYGAHALRCMPRVIRAIGSFAVVLAAYGAYALVAVPLIEPPSTGRHGDLGGLTPMLRSRNSAERFASLFPADSWVLSETPKILESGQGKLLFQDYKNLGGEDGRYRVQLVPIAIVFTPEADENADESADGANAENEGQVVVLEAPGGAILEFDEPLRLSRMQFGRLIGGRLVGPVTIRSDGKLPGPEDDLLITTDGIELSEEYIKTSSAVDFRFGPHYGRGHGMTIKLLPGDESHRKRRRGPSIGGIESFELLSVERLCLELGKDKLASERETLASAQRGGNASGKEPAKFLVEITCEGPFRFDAVGKIATFSDRVAVRRIHPNGPADQINCEWLSIFFVKRTETTERPNRPNGANGPNEPGQAELAGTFDLEPQRIVARGNPVIVVAPSREVYARGQLLEYDLQTDAITLDATHEVVLRQGHSEIHARKLDYRSQGSGRLGDLIAEGPGWFRAVIDDRRPDEPFEAAWNELLKMRRYEGSPVISLYGSANLSSRQTGRLDAPEIHFYLRETPRAGDPAKFDVRPDRMLACQANQMLVSQELPATTEAARLRGMNHNILLRSPQFSAALRRLEIWFEETTTASLGSTPSDRRPSVYAMPHGPSSTAMVDSTVDSTMPRRESHFEIVGQLLRAKVLMREKQDPELSELTVEGGIRFVETQTGKPNEKPMILDGDRLHAVDVSRPHTAVTVTGRPAHFEARGLSLTGSNINLNRGTNLLWIDGPGRMNVPIDRDLEGEPLSSPSTLEIAWQERMKFDGRKASFEESVTATGPSQRVETETLEVHFRRAIDFSAKTFEGEQQPDILQILCRGGVRMTSRTYEGRKQTSQEEMQVVDLSIHLDSGDLTASGPGWVNSVRYGAGDRLRLPGTETKATAPNGARGDDEELKCLHVRFQGSIEGNVRHPHRHMTFLDQVRTTYAPVDRFDTKLTTNDPDQLGPKGVVMRCGQLSVHEMNATAARRGTMELEAHGNVVIEGVDFTARAIRMTYSQAKDLLILEGDGRTDAELFRQKHLGGQTSHATARKILYWPKTEQLRVEDARSFELNQFSARR